MSQRGCYANAYGRLLDNTIPTNITTRLYTHSIHDLTTGLYKIGARWYDSQLGLWLTPDSIVPNINNPSAWNPYAFNYNNPVNYVDPSGHMPWLAIGIGILVGGFAGGTCAHLGQGYDIGSSDWWAWTLGGAVAGGFGGAVVGALVGSELLWAAASATGSAIAESAGGLANFYRWQSFGTAMRGLGHFVLGGAKTAWYGTRTVGFAAEALGTLSTNAFVLNAMAGGLGYSGGIVMKDFLAGERLGTSFRWRNLGIYALFGGFIGVASVPFSSLGLASRTIGFGIAGVMGSGGAYVMEQLTGGQSSLSPCGVSKAAFWGSIFNQASHIRSITKYAAFALGLNATGATDQLPWFCTP